MDFQNSQSFPKNNRSKATLSLMNKSNKPVALNILMNPDCLSWMDMLILHEPIGLVGSYGDGSHGKRSILVTYAKKNYQRHSDIQILGRMKRIPQKNNFD